MQVTAVTPILNVSDIGASIRWFERLGWQRSFAWNAGGVLASDSIENEHGPATFASVCAGSVQVFLCRDGQGMRGGPPPRFDGDDTFGANWMSLWLPSPADVDAAHARALANGIQVIWPPTDEPWGVRECCIMHPDGHVFRLSADLPD